MQEKKYMKESLGLSDKKAIMDASYQSAKIKRIYFWNLLLSTRYSICNAAHTHESDTPLLFNKEVCFYMV